MIDENLLHAFLTLMLCVLGLGVVLFLVKRYSAKISPQKQTVDMKVLGRLSLQKATVYTIQAGDRILVVGTTDHSITTLADITPDAAASKQIDTRSAALGALAAPIQEAPPSPDPTADNLSFAAFLQSISHRRKN
ncbi:MAG: flagellar biosynthetic protein FliO [Candidatus Kapaibacterium sp.]